MYCPKCGCKLTDELFCPECGTRVADLIAASGAIVQQNVPGQVTPDAPPTYAPMAGPVPYAPDDCEEPTEAFAQGQVTPDAPPTYAPKPDQVPYEPPTYGPMPQYAPTPDQAPYAPADPEALQAEFASGKEPEKTVIITEEMRANLAKPVTHESAPAVPEKAPEKKRSSKKRGLIIAIAGVLVAAMLFSVGWFVIRPMLLSKNNEPEEDQLAEYALTDEQKTDLLKYVDDAEGVFAESEAGRKALDESDYSGMASVYENALSEIDGLRKDCSALGIQDEKLAAAADSYFGMLYDSCSGRLTVCRFMDDCSQSFIGLLDSRPDLNSYRSGPGPQYISDMTAWLDQIRNSYDAISCPDCISSEWTEFGSIIDTNEPIIDKAKFFVYNDDPLSRYAAYTLDERYVQYQQQQQNKLYSRYESSLRLSQQQYLKAAELKEELHSYTDLKPKAKSTYEFKNTAKNEPVFIYESPSVIYPAFYSTYDAFLIVKAGCLSGNRDIVVEAEIPGFTQQYKGSFNIGPDGLTIYIKSPMLTGSIDLSSAKESQIQISIYDKNGTDLIESKTIPVTIKSKNDFEWFTDDFGTATKYNILSFLMPESDAITELKRLAIDEISYLTDGNLQAFVGYQETGYSHEDGTYVQALGLMRALYKSGVRYNNDAFSISGSNQHILFPDEVLQSKTGLCIETSLVIASALQSAGMHAYLVFPPGHAQVAVEVFNDGDGRGEYLLIETTRLTADSVNESVMIASYEEWLNYLDYYDCDVIDCDDAAALGIIPFVH